jgi:hypothetical protein
MRVPGARMSESGLPASPFTGGAGGSATLGAAADTAPPTEIMVDLGGAVRTWPALLSSSPDNTEPIVNTPGSRTEPRKHPITIAGNFVAACTNETQGEHFPRGTDHCVGDGVGALSALTYRRRCNLRQPRNASTFTVTVTLDVREARASMLAIAAR